jgi:predicted CXXCH cytochrome family protein
VILDDVTPPVVSVPADFSVHTTDPAGTIVAYSGYGATDPDDAAGPVTCTPPPGSVFAIGTTSVSCSSTDTHGNTGSASFNLTVILDDVTPPSVTGVSPSGTIPFGSPTITVDYSDAGSGIDTSSVVVTLDGSALSCTVTATQATCATGVLAAGPHDIGGSVSDNSGNTTTIIGGFNMLPAPDTTPPTVTSVSPSGDIPAGSTTVSVVYYDNDSGIDPASLVITLDGSPLSCSSPTTTPVTCATGVLSTGSHTIGGSVSDNAGNTSPIIGSFNVLPAPDVTAPVVTSFAPTGVISTDSTTIDVSYSDSESGVDTSSVVVQLSSVTLSCTITSTGASCPASGLSDGSLPITVTLSDNAGNTASYTNYFSVDTTGPVVVSVSPSGSINSSSTTIDVYYHDWGAGGPVVPSSVSLTLDGITLTGCSLTATSSHCSVSGLSLGTHTIGGSVSDTVGNTSPISGSFDVTDPWYPTITSIQPSGSIATDSTTIVTTYNDNWTGIDVSSVSVSLDSTVLGGCTITASGASCPVSGLTDGQHWITVSVSDNAGKNSTVTSGFWIDTHAPVVTSVLPSGSQTNDYASIEAHYNDGSGLGVDTASVHLTLDGASLSGCTVGIASATCPATGLSIGTHTIGGSVSDVSGNTASIAGSFTVLAPDTTPPVLTLPGNTGLTTTDPSGAVWSFSASATDDRDGPVAVTCTPPAGASYTYPVGTTPVSCSASDAAGNTATGGFDVNVVWNDVTPPVVSVPADMTVHTTDPAGTAVSFTATASDPDDAAGPVTCTPPSGSVFSVGTTAVSCSSTDTHSNTGTASFNIEVILDDITPPSIYSVLPTGTIGSSSTTISATYFDSGSGVQPSSVVITLDGNPLSGCTITGVRADCPVSGLSNGTHTIHVSLADNAGNPNSADSFFDVFVDTTPPVLSVPADMTVHTTNPSGRAAYFSVTASDPDDATGPVTCTPPSGSTFIVGTTAVSCSSTDTHGNTGTASFNIEVIWDDVTPPVVSVPADMTVHTFDPAGTAVSFTATASDPDDAAGPVTCTPPSGSTFTIGTTTVSCSSTDTHSNTGTASFNIEVILDVPPETTPPEIGTVSPSGTISSNWTMVFVSYSDSGSGIDTGSVHVTLDGAALTCTISASSANCSVTDLADGPHNIGGSVADHDGNVAPFSGGFIVSYLPPAENLLSPHGSYGTGNAGGSAKTDYCLTCHDVHNAAGDYVLMRESTVTNVCGTCHMLYGNDTGSSPTWTEPPCDRAPGSTSSGCTADLNTSSPEATVSPSAAYKNTNSASGHRLGLGNDTIPASSNSLKVIRSEDYEEGEIYDHNAASSLSATSGLYCASCHTPHGSITGRDFPACPDPDGAGPEVAPANGPACDADTDKDIPTPTAVYASGGTGVITGEFFSGDQLVVDDSGAEHPHRAYPQWLASSNPNHLSARVQTGEADGDADGVFCEATDGFVAADDQYGTAPGTIIPNGLCDKMMDPVDPVQSRDEFCLRCHDRQWNGHGFEGAFEGEGTGGNNHPPLCMSCHGPAMETNTGTNDFPHTSENYKILSKNHDGLCLGCHSTGRLP